MHGRLETWNLSSHVHIRYLTGSLRSLVRYRCEHSKINSISSRAHVLFSINTPLSHLPSSTNGKKAILCNCIIIIIIIIHNNTNTTILKSGCTPPL